MRNNQYRIVRPLQIAAGSVRQRLNTLHDNGISSASEAPDYSFHRFYMTVQEVVDLGYPEHYIRDRLADKTIPFQKSGSKFYINVPLMLALFDEESINNMESESAEMVRRAMERQIGHRPCDENSDCIETE